jgi:glycosyltransferase involved in cell wall biosynthesis
MECRLLYLVGQLGVGGLERQLFYLIRSMDRKRYKPAVAVWGNSLDDFYAREISGLGVPLVALGRSSTRSAKFRGLWRLVSVIRPQVVHSYTFYTNIAAWFAARASGAIPLGSVRNNFLLDRRETGKVLGRLCGRWPSAQVFNSFAAERNANRSGIFRPCRTYVVRNGVDLKRFSPEDYPQRGYILCVGNLYARKRWDRLIRAVAKLASKGDSFQVMHVGSGPLRGELEAMTKDLRVDHMVRFLGARHDIPALLAKAAFLVHTAEDEGCPNVIMEAMACGRAIVATDAGDVPLLIDNGKTGFVVPRDDEAALGSQIATLLKDTDFCRRMGEAGRIKAEQDFGIERLRSETFAAYRAEGWEDR